MGTIKALYDSVQQINLRAEAPKIIERTSGTITLLNKEQLYGGLSVDGNKIEPYRSKKYAEFKHDMNPRPGFGVMDYFLTGAFYRGFFVSVTATTFEVDSTDWKKQLLEAKGFKMFGLSKESISNYAFGSFHEELQKYIEGVTGLKFR